MKTRKRFHHLKGLFKGLIKRAAAQSLIKELSQSLIKELSQSLIKELLQSLIKELLQNLINELPQSLINELPQSLIKLNWDFCKVSLRNCHKVSLRICRKVSLSSMRLLKSLIKEFSGDLARNEMCYFSSA